MNQIQRWETKGELQSVLRNNGVRGLFKDGAQGEKEYRNFGVTLRNTVLSNPKAVGSASMESIVAVSMEAAKKGVMIDGKEACIVPFAGKASLVIMPAGMYKAFYTNPEVKRVYADVVYSNDEFDHLPIESTIHHRPNYMSDRGDVVLAYAIADMLRDGEKVRLIQIVTKSDLDSAQAASKSGRNGPWGSFYNEMCKKTALRRLSKVMPNRLEDYDDSDFDAPVASDLDEIEINPAPAMDTNALLQAAPAPQPAPQPVQQPVYEQPASQPQPAPVYEQSAPAQQQQPAYQRQQPVQQAQPVQQIHSDDDWDDASHLDVDPFAGEVV